MLSDSGDLHERDRRSGSGASRSHLRDLGRPAKGMPRDHVSAAGRADQRGGARSSLGTADVEPVPPPATMVPPAPPAQPMVERARRPFEVPEYLRVGQSGKWKPLAMTLLLAFLLSAVALRAMGPFDRNHPLMRLLGVSPSVEVTQGSRPSAAAPVPESRRTEGRPSRRQRTWNPARQRRQASRLPHPRSRRQRPIPRVCGRQSPTEFQPGNWIEKPATPPGVQPPPAAETRKPLGEAEPGEPRQPSEKEEEMLPATEPKPGASPEEPQSARRGRGASRGAAGACARPRRGWLCQAFSTGLPRAIRCGIRRLVPLASPYQTHVRRSADCVSDVSAGNRADSGSAGRVGRPFGGADQSRKTPKASRNWRSSTGGR